MAVFHPVTSASVERQAGRWTKYSIHSSLQQAGLFRCGHSNNTGLCIIRAFGQLHELGMIDMNILSGISQTHTLWKGGRNGGSKSRYACVLVIWTQLYTVGVNWCVHRNTHTYTYICVCVCPLCRNFLKVLFTLFSLFAVKSHSQTARVFKSVKPLK